MALAVVALAVLLYAIADLPRAPTAGQFASYGVELAIPLLGWWLTRRGLEGKVETAALCTDLLFTARPAGRLFLDTTTLSGTALFLSLKLLASALLWPWHPASPVSLRRLHAGDLLPRAGHLRPVAGLDPSDRSAR